MRNHRRADAGVTLVEMLIATVLLAFILLAIAPLFIASVRSNYSANEYTSIHNLARDRLEQLMSIPIPEPDAIQNPAYIPQLDLNGGDGFGNYPNDLPLTLPDPVTGLITATTVRNPLIRTYVVTHWNTDGAPCADGCTPAAWTYSPVLTIDTPYEFKRIDVTVSSVASSLSPLSFSRMGIGSRTARVTGFLRNPDPGFNKR